MKSALSFAVWMTLFSVVFKLSLYASNVDLQDSILYVAFFNLLVISTGTFFGIRKFKIVNASTSFKAEVKAGMRITSLYAIFMAVFVYFYYNNIDATAFSELIEARMANARAAIESGQNDVPLDEIRRVSLTIFSAKTHATITLFGFIVAGAIYSLLISYFMKRLPGFK